MTDAQLAGLVARLRRLADEQLAPLLARAMAPVVQERIDAGFRARKSPDGVAWTSAKQVRPHPLLVASGRLRRGFSVQATASGIRVRNAVPYATVQQRGARLRRRRRNGGHRGKVRLGSRLPARPMVPATRWASTSSIQLRSAAKGLVRALLGRTAPR